MVSRTKDTTRPLRDAAITAHGTCPLCCQSLPPTDFLHTKDFGILVRSSHVAMLSSNEAALFRIILDNRAEGISHDALTERQYSGGSGGPMSAKECVYGAVAGMRRKLKPLKIVIESFGKKYRPRFNA